MLQILNNPPNIFYKCMPRSPTQSQVFVLTQLTIEIENVHCDCGSFISGAVGCPCLAVPSLGSGVLQRGAGIIINLPGLSRTLLVIWNCWVSICERSCQGKVVMGDGSLFRTEWWIWHPAGRVWGVENKDYTLVVPSQAFSNQLHIHFCFLSRERKKTDSTVILLRKKLNWFRGFCRV